MKRRWGHVIFGYGLVSEVAELLVQHTYEQLRSRVSRDNVRRIARKRLDQDGNPASTVGGWGGRGRTLAEKFALAVLGVGCIVDGVPPMLALTEGDIQVMLGM